MSHLVLMFPALALIASATTFGFVTQLPSVTAVLAVFLVIAWAVNGRVEVSPYAQGFGTLLAVLTGVTLTTLLVESDIYIRSVMYGCAIVSLCIAAFRLVQTSPRYGQRGTAVLGIIPLIVAGALPSGTGYVIGAVAWATLAIVTLLLDDPSEPGLSNLSGRRMGFLAATMIAATALAGSLAIALPPVQKWAIDRYVLGYLTSRTGFGRHFQLGSLTSIMESQDVAMRAYGPYPGYLRGIVYGIYRAGTWSQFDDSEPRKVRVDTFDAGLSNDWTRIERVGENEGDRYFAPLGADHIAVDDGRLRVSEGGILLAAPKARATRLAFRATGASEFPAAPPSEIDLEVPVELRHTIRDVLEAWTTPEMVPREKLANIRDRLKTTYAYSLNHTRSTLEDPVIDFLLENRIGHCEFFASALALLARSAGIPARVVGGYLVSERNPFGNYWVVRERDAHAWVEVWFPESGWETWDATPAGALAEVTRGDVSWVRSLFEYLAMLVDHGIEGLDRQSLYPLLAALLAALVYLRLRALRSTRGARDDGPQADRPLPCYEELADYLLALGLARRSGETLHQFARRVRAAPYGHASELAELMLDYARYRYGHKGNERNLSQRTTEIVHVA
jgi:transglutaminase-like putative cysteine protease